MTKQELEEELEAQQWRPKQVYTKREKNALAQVARAKSQTKKIQQKAQVRAYLESSKNTPRNQKGSVSLKKSNPIQMCHNDRTEPPSYLLESGGMGVECNRGNREAQILKQRLIDEASMAYTARTGQRLQAKSYEWSAVCNIKPTTTMQDLEAVAKHFETKYGFQCYQIAIHRDEGYIDENGQEQINHHAHLEFITLDKETGRNRQRELKKQDTSRIQTEVAEILQMERGIDKRISKRERIEPRHFAKLADEIKQETKIHKEREALQSAITKLQDQKPQIKLTSDKSEMIYLNVPYDEKDEAKELGAKWDKDKRQWYIPQVDSAPFSKWLPSNFKSKSQEIAELHEQIAKNNEAFDSLKHKLNTEQALLESHEKTHKATIEALFKRHEAEIEAIKAQHKQEIVGLKAIKAEFEAPESKNNAIEAKISDLESKQGESIAEVDSSDLKANYEANKGDKGYKTDKETLKEQKDKLQGYLQAIRVIICDGDVIKARQMKPNALINEIKRLKEAEKSKQEPQREPKQAQIQVKPKNKDFER